MAKVKIQNGLFTRAQLDTNSFNAADNTIDVVFATDTPVKRYDWSNGRYYNEVLGISDDEINMERLEAGAPVLDSHDKYSIRSQIGVVQKAWVENGEARATLKLSNREDLKPIVDDIKAGIIKNISAGYSVQKFRMEDTGPATKDNTIPTYRAINWTPSEISFVPVPADHRSGTRAQEGTETTEVILISTNNNLDMNTNGQRSEENAATTTPGTENTQQRSEPTQQTTTQSAPVENAEQIRQQGADQERTRSAEILSSVRKAGLPINFAETLIAGPQSLDECRTAIIDELAKTGTQPSTGPTFRMNGDENDRVRESLENALMFRMDNSVKLESERATDFRNAGMLEIGRELLDVRGIKTKGLDKSELYQRAMSSSDFPALLSNVANKILRKAYSTAPQTWKPLASRMDARDFKAITGIQIDGSLGLEEVQENGEYKYGSLKESSDTFQLKSYGKIIKITRKAIINDDLNGLSRIGMLYGRAAANLESDTIYGILTKNVKMGDNNAIFSAAHNNLLTGANSVLSTTALSSARILLAKQLGLSGKATEVLNLLPVYLVVPIELLTTAQQLMSSIYANKTDDVNVFNGAYKIISDARFTNATEWYLTADPSQIDMLLYGYLEGQGLRTETRQGFEVDGVEIKAAMDFGAGIWDYRGFVKSNGK